MGKAGCVSANSFVMAFATSHGFPLLLFLIYFSLNDICRGGIISHSFELEAKEKGIFNGAPALITFRIPTKAALQVGCLQPVPLFLVLAV